MKLRLQYSTRVDRMNDLGEEEHEATSQNVVKPVNIVTEISCFYSPVERAANTKAQHRSVTMALMLTMTDCDENHELI